MIVINVVLSLSVYKIPLADNYYQNLSSIQGPLFAAKESGGALKLPQRAAKRILVHFELKLRHLVASILVSFLRNYLPNFQIRPFFRIIAYTTFILKITTLKNGLGRKLTLNLMKLRNNKRYIISAICSLWPKSGTAKCITSRPTFKRGTARAVPLTYVPTPLKTFVDIVLRIMLCYFRFITCKLLNCRAQDVCRVCTCSGDVWIVHSAQFVCNQVLRMQLKLRSVM